MNIKTITNYNELFLCCELEINEIAIISKMIEDEPSRTISIFKNLKGNRLLIRYKPKIKKYLTIGSPFPDLNKTDLLLLENLQDLETKKIETHKKVFKNKTFSRYFGNSPKNFDNRIKKERKKRRP